MPSSATARRPAGRRVAYRVAGPVVAALLVVAGPVGGGPDLLAPTAAGAGEVPDYHPTRLAHLGGAGQVVVVTAPRWSARRGTLRAYERAPDGRWHRVLDAGRVWLGARGLVRADRRRQDTLTTPAGTFPLPWAFGTGADPGTALRYRPMDRRDWWPYDPGDPATYNVWQQHRSAAAGWRRDRAEHLSAYGRQYRHAVVVGFNLPTGVHWAGGERVARHRADTRRGGGIFLHVQARAVADRPTAGCVAMPAARLVALLRWLDPARGPVLVIGPRSAIDRL